MRKLRWILYCTVPLILPFLGLDAYVSWKDLKPFGEKEAQAYGAKVDGWNNEVECMNRDTDSNGYVSCTIFLKGGTTTPIECANWTWPIQWNEGCRPLVARVNVTNTPPAAH